MISSDLYIFGTPCISACLAKVAIHIQALIVRCAIWPPPKYYAGILSATGLYLSSNYKSLRGIILPKPPRRQLFHEVQARRGITPWIRISKQSDALFLRQYRFTINNICSNSRWNHNFTDHSKGKFNCSSYLTLKEGKEKGN